MPIPDTTDVSTLIRFFKKDKPEWSHKQCVAVAMSVAKRNGAKDTDTSQEKKASYEAPQTGPEAILHALENIDLDQVEKEAREELKTGKRTKRSGAVAKLNIVQGMRRNKQTPSDYIMSMVPIVPTKYRPFAAAGGTFIPGDANVLYKDLFDVLAAHKEEKEMYGKENAGSSLLDLYDAISSVQGYGEPVKAKTKAKEVKGFLEKIVGSTSKFCFDDKTEILTKKYGWVFFKDLKEDTEVATINPGTLAFEWQQPHAYTHSRYIGDMVQIKLGYSVDQLVTPRHRVWMRSRKQDEHMTDEVFTKDWEIVQAGMILNLRNRHWYQIAAHDWKGSTVLPECAANVSKEDFATWLGWWVAEGDIHADGTMLNVYQTDANPDYLKELDELFTRIKNAGLSVSIKNYWSEVEGRRVHIYHYAIKANRVLADWVRSNVGHLAWKKELSQEIKNWEKQHLELLLSAYLKGDGSKRRHYEPRGFQKGITNKNRNPLTDSHHSFITTSHKLLDDFMEVGFKCGICIRETYTMIPKEGDKYNRRPAYRGGVIGKWTTGTESISSKSNVGFVPYNGHVHCCSVDNGLLVVRRNGKAIVSGNSYFQRRLLSKTQDNTGRSTLIAAPEYGIDEIGIPKDMAFTMYAPYIQRRLKQSGMRDAEALKHVKERTPEALRALEKEVKVRPVLYSRAPAWHKFNIVAGNPILIDGDAIATNPYIMGGMAGDWDGDTMNVHVPSSDKAVKEAYERMMPQDTPFSDRQPDKIIPLPKQEQILGLYTAATAPATQPVVFNTEEEALHAIRSGKVRLSQDIEILNRQRQPNNTPHMKFPELQFTAVETPARITPTNVKITEGPIVTENGRVTKPITLTYPTKIARTT